MLLAYVMGVALIGQAPAASASTTATTAWHDGSFHVDVPGVVHSSDVVLGRPNTASAQAMPLGNGSLGVGVWDENGLTVQLNRADTLPDRLSPGQLVVPGLAKLTSAPDYKGRLDLYDGTFTQSGGGMTATTYVRSDTDQLVVDVTGADPAAVQTARLHLWQPRTPTASASSTAGTLAQTWKDDTQPGGGGETFGALAAVTATGRDVHAGVVDPLTVQVSVKPRPNGSFRIAVASPRWTGGDPSATAERLLAGSAAASVPGRTAAWWHHYWSSVGLMNLSSPDGSAQYLANLRTISLFAAAAERGTVRPGSQAGVADLFDSAGDTHSWDPASYWGWNLRMLVTANLGAGAYANNDAYFALYRDALPNTLAWTASQFPGSAGACTPETMRFNGVGVQVHLANGQWGANPYLNCSSQGPANYNVRTLSTGAEVSLFAWQTYQATDDLDFLRQNYPLMAGWARFMLSYAEVGADGRLHTSPSNAHETQWDVSDPTTDIAAMTAVFPEVIQAAQLLHRDQDLVAELTAALPKVLPYPRTDAATMTQQLDPSADATAQDVIGQSYQQAVKTHNQENLGLEPVWPYGLIGDSGPLSDLAARTFTDRPYVEHNDWSFDPIEAARLGLGDDMAKELVDLTEAYQKRPSGLASFGATYQEPYAEQGAVVATALQDALVQDYDGLLRIAPAAPTGWNADATVFIQHRSRVDVQLRDGAPVTVAIEAGANVAQQVRNPWPGQRVKVVADGRTVVGPTSASRFTVPLRAGHSYLVERDGAPKLPFAPVSGSPATSARTLGPVEIGLPDLD
ncbi:glycosyl hydrolase family 95 catalytic domain-containing protein [Streptomyces sp. NRRL F-5123]|uniref:glycosyl hydrolase family 95 catalytic domain-containing protein n=1 Tax=Streptomyces sp. NRRL F-5123 TaxID=1463856 RepID=UPI0005B82361|nr:glycoside hydrolase [Streptomyces sp. NRRL F-5123]